MQTTPSHTKTHSPCHGAQHGTQRCGSQSLGRGRQGTQSQSEHSRRRLRTREREHEQAEESGGSVMNKSCAAVSSCATPPLTSLLGVADPPVDVVKAVEGAVGGLLAFLVGSLDTCTCVFLCGSTSRECECQPCNPRPTKLSFTIVWVRVL